MTPALSIRGLVVKYGSAPTWLSPNDREFTAVNGVTLEVRRGEVLGLVGESGCGKSSLAKAAIRLVNSKEGSVTVNGADFLKLKGRELRDARSKIQMIFQDPYGSLNPRQTVFDILAEPLIVHRGMKGAELDRAVRRSLEQVSLPESAGPKYPHEFSGGQRQRLAIARALVLDPEVLVADEPVSSLDVSVQAQILNLLKKIQKEHQLAMVFVSHNLAVVRYLADRIAVMYLGRIVEEGPADQIFAAPSHPYTQALLASVPIPDPRRAMRAGTRVFGEASQAPTTGCSFANRCPLVHDRCRGSVPPLEALSAEKNRVVRCYAAEQSYRAAIAVNEGR